MLRYLSIWSILAIGVGASLSSCEDERDVDVETPGTTYETEPRPYGTEPRTGGWEEEPGEFRERGTRPEPMTPEPVTPEGQPEGTWEPGIQERQMTEEQRAAERQGAAMDPARRGVAAPVGEAVIIVAGGDSIQQTAREVGRRLRDEEMRVIARTRVPVGDAEQLLLIFQERQPSQLVLTDDPTAALLMPNALLVFEDEAGVHVAYRDPRRALGSVTIKDPQQLEDWANRLSAIASAGAQRATDEQQQQQQPGLQQQQPGLQQRQQDQGQPQEVPPTEDRPQQIDERDQPQPMFE